MKYLNISICIGLIMGMGLGGVVNATTVENEITVQASTGGNSTTGSQGKGEASIFIETSVNGEVVQHVEEHQESEQGEPIHIEKSVEYNNGAVQVGGQAKASASQAKIVETKDSGDESIITTKEQVEEQPVEDLGDSENQAGEEDQ